MAGSVTVIERPATQLSQRVGLGAKLIRWAWTSDALGNADLSSSNEYGGIVRALKTVPGEGDSAPTVNYDITVDDDFGFDVLGGKGSMRKLIAETAEDDKDFHYFASTKLTLFVINAGNAKSGVVFLIILGL